MQDITNNHPYYFYSETEVEWKNQKFKRKVAFAGIADNNTLKIGQSICSEKDIFDKVKGRKIAEGRAIKKPIVIIDLNQYEGKKNSDIFVQVCKEILNGKTETIS